LKEISEKDLEILLEIFIAAIIINFFVFFFSSLTDSIRISLTTINYFKELASSKIRRKIRRKILTISKILTFENRRDRRIYYKIVKKNKIYQHTHL